MATPSSSTSGAGDPTTTSSVLPNRLMSLDAYRGLAMFLMVAEVLHLCRVAEHFRDSRVWEFLCFHQSHVAWIGCSIHDMIQPSFSFMVGAALPFSIASRRARGQSSAAMIAHAFFRAAVLILLGIFLRSLRRDQTYFTFEDTLTQIGLGYGFLFCIGLRSCREAWIALAVILVGYWLAFAAYPVPMILDPDRVGEPFGWPHWMTGLEAHWNKNVNLAADFERWFLNLFPRESSFDHNGGGYVTLSFIPTLGTMILGLIAGRWLRSDRPAAAKVGLLVGGGAVLVAVGAALGYLHICPIVKRIWTPSFALYSGGFCFWILAVMYLVIDVARFRAWAFPLVVIGMNSIAIYVMSWTIEGFVHDAWHRHLSEKVFKIFGEPYEPLVGGSLVIITFWLILYWMYRRRLFLRI